MELLEWYRRRWRVEIFFRILESGCRVETLQLGTLERLERALVIYSIIAGASSTPSPGGGYVPISHVRWFSTPKNGKPRIVAHRAKPPDTSPPLGQMTRLIVGFDGSLGRKGDGHLGPKAIGEGIRKIYAFAIGIAAAK